MGISKIILMYPNFKWDKWLGITKWSMHPYNLGLIASIIEKEYGVSIIDANMEDLEREEFLQVIKEKQPDVVGVSVITNEYANSGIEAARIVKQANPNIKVVIGGVSANSNPRPYIESPDVDYVVVGEGEYVFRDLCLFLDGKGSFPEKGVWYKKDGKIIDKGRTDMIQDLDALPLPAYHLVDFMKYATTIQRESIDMPRELPYARIRTSRGCPYSCCFCEVGSISGKNPRMRSLQNVAKEIEWLIEKYGIKSIIFDDDNLIIDKERSKDLFRMMIEKKYNLKWNAPGIAVYKLDEEIIKLMKDSGCQYLNIAIESGNERVLKDIIHKPLELKQAKEAIELIKKYDIDLCANFVVGFPGETWQEIRETIKFAEELDINYVKIYSATPFPNTELYKIVKNGGYLREDFDPNKHLWTDGWIKSSEFRPEDLRILRAYEWDRINFTDPKKRQKTARMMNITEERLNEIRRDTLKRANP